MLIAVINESKLITDSDVDTMCKAVHTQVEQHVLPAWNMKDCSVQFYADKTQVPGSAWLVHVLDDPTVAGALGYHSEDNSRVVAFIFCQPVLKNGGVVLYDSNHPQNTSVSSVLSHEVLEMIGDQYACWWSDGPELPQGSQYALELCDPVEGDSYTIPVTVNGAEVKVSVSNFVYPAWFDAQAINPEDMPFDFLQKLTKPFTMTQGGYMIVRQAGQVSQVFADGIPEWKMELKAEKRANKFNRR